MIRDEIIVGYSPLIFRIQPKLERKPRANARKIGQPRRHMPNNHEHASSALMYPESMQSPGLFINTIPYLPIWYLANLNILACYFSFFNSFVQLHPQMC